MKVEKKYIEKIVKSHSVSKKKIVSNYTFVFRTFQGVFLIE